MTLDFFLEHIGTLQMYIAKTHYITSLLDPDGMRTVEPSDS